MLIEIDENKLGKEISHYEIRKRKDCIAVVEIRRGETVQVIELPNVAK